MTVGLRGRISCLNDKSLPKSLHPTFLLPHRWDKQAGRGNAKPKTQNKENQKSRNTKDEGGKVGKEIQNPKSTKYKIKIVLEITAQMGQMRRERKCICEAKSCRNSISIGIIPVQLFAKLAKSWNSTNYHSERCFAESAISIYL